MKFIRSIGNCYWNGKGVDAYETIEGDVFLQGVKIGGSKIRPNKTIVSKEYFEEHFSEDSLEVLQFALDLINPSILEMEE